MQSSTNILTGSYQKSWFDGFDLRFFLILLGAILLESLVVVLMTQQPVEVYSEKEIARLQAHFASFVLGETARPEATNGALAAGTQGGDVAESEAEEAPVIEDKPAGEDGGGEGGEGREATSGAGRQAARAAAASAKREAMTREVSNKGLLRMLTGTGSAASGGAVSDLLGAGSGSGSGNLDEVLAAAGGLKTGGTAGLGAGGGQGGSARGGRSGDKASINDLVSDLGGARSQSMERKGELAVEAPADVEGRGQRSVNRSPQEIQRVIMGHLKAIQYCYERELKRNPELKGKVTVRITVHPEGHVSAVTIVTSTLNNERVERCIRSRILNWKDFKPIEPSEGDVIFRQSFTFGY